MSTRPADRSGHLIVCGLNGLGLRLAETLHEMGAEVVIVAEKPRRAHLAAVHALGITVIEGSGNDEPALLEAGIGSARAVALVDDDDIGNLRGALLAGKHNPSMRIVLRLFNEDLGERIESLFDNCSILSQSAIAAPFFAAAAAGEEDGDRLAIAGRALLVRRVSAGRDVDKPDATGDRLLMPLANAGTDGPELFPAGAADGGAVLIDLGRFDDQEAVRQARPAIRHRFRDGFALLRQLMDRRIKVMSMVVVLTLAFGTTFFSLAKGMSVIDGLYFSVVTLATVGYGDINLQNDQLFVKIVGILYIITGAAITATLFAILTDTLIGVRLARALGSIRGRVAGHVVVCGLGNVGLRVVQDLVQRGQRVVAVERDEDSRHVATVRRMGVPVVFGDATLSETLETAQIRSASALVSATDDDVADLQTAVLARSLHSGVRIILRLFDHELSTAIERRFNIHISRSSAAIAAPVFAAEMMGEVVVATVNVAGTTLVFAELVAGAESALCGKSVAEIQAAGDVRVLAVTPPRAHDAEWTPPGDRVLGTDDSVALVGRPRAIEALRQPSAGS